MTECDHEDCSKVPVGQIIWETESDVSGAYCNKHLEQARNEIPDFIQGVQIV